MVDSREEEDSNLCRPTLTLGERGGKRDVRPKDQLKMVSLVGLNIVSRVGQVGSV